MARLTDDCYLGVATDAATFAGPRHRAQGKPVCGLLAIALPGASCVVAIDMAEWVAAQVTVCEHAGATHAQPPSAMERARAAKPARK